MPPIRESRPLIRRAAAALSCIAVALAAPGPLGAQERESAAGLVALHQAVLDLGTDAVVLNVAAHPDDESSRTNVILRRKHGMHVVTVYTTYGDGGQNAIGNEIGPELAHLRVRETLAAAAISDVQVRWLGMQDFGFSKTLEETLHMWGADRLKDAMRRVLDDVDPDIVITNHSLDQGHGHHRASFWAIREVLHERSERGQHVPPLYRRCGADDAQLTLDPGEVDPARGETYARLAHRSWTRHVTQGPWGAHNPTRTGKDHWKLVYPEGVDAAAAADLKRWVRESEAALALHALLAQPDGPALVEQRMRDDLPGLLGAGEPGLRRGNRWRALNRLLLARHGIDIECWLDTEEVAVGGIGRINVVVHGVDRIEGLEVRSGAIPAVPMQAPVRNDPFEMLPAPPNGSGATGGEAPAAAATPVPAIPRQPAPKGRDDKFAIEFPCADAPVDGDGLPVPEPCYVPVTAEFQLAGVRVALHQRLHYTAVEPIVITFDREVVMIPKGRVVDRVLSASVRKHQRQDVFEFARLGLGIGVKAEVIPARLNLNPEHPEARLLIRANFDGTEIDREASLRLGVSGLMEPLRVLPVDVTVPEGLRVGLVRGPDDTLERALADLGVNHVTLDRDALLTARLEDFTTVLLDMRTYHHRPELAEMRDRILQFCRAGGRVVAMYHKPNEWNERPGQPALSPFPLTIGNERTTEEDSPVVMLQPGHLLWTQPHRIEPGDFDGWVQERGLNFPSKWDPAWVPLLETKDKADEKAHQGALLYTQYGRGDFVYCSLVLYRQLRVGHAGAARLLINLLSR